MNCHSNQPSKRLAYRVFALSLGSPTVNNVSCEYKVCCCWCCLYVCLNIHIYTNLSDYVCENSVLFQWKSSIEKPFSILFTRHVWDNEPSTLASKNLFTFPYLPRRERARAWCVQHINAKISTTQRLHNRNHAKELAELKTSSVFVVLLRLTLLHITSQSCVLFTFCVLCTQFKRMYIYTTVPIYIYIIYAQISTYALSLVYSTYSYSLFIG